MTTFREDTGRRPWGGPGSAEGDGLYAMPEIGTHERDALEQEAIAVGGNLLAQHESLSMALGGVRAHFGYTVAANELAKHVEQVWIGRILS